MVEVAARAGVSVETVRKIEHGRIPTPAFFTVVALARAVDLPIDELCRLLDDTDGQERPATPHRRSELSSAKAAPTRAAL
jgi:transcriptional regulator with XRE-family HTH domain